MLALHPPYENVPDAQQNIKNGIPPPTDPSWHGGFLEVRQRSSEDTDSMPLYICTIVRVSVAITDTSIHRWFDSFRRAWRETRWQAIYLSSGSQSRSDCLLCHQFLRSVSNNCLLLLCLLFLLSPRFPHTAAVIRLSKICGSVIQHRARPLGESSSAWRSCRSCYRWSMPELGFAIRKRVNIAAPPSASGYCRFERRQRFYSCWKGESAQER